MKESARGRTRDSMEISLPGPAHSASPGKEVHPVPLSPARFSSVRNLTLPPTNQTQDLPNSRIEVRVIDDLKTDSVSTQIKGREIGTRCENCDCASSLG